MHSVVADSGRVELALKKRNEHAAMPVFFARLDADETRTVIAEPDRLATFLPRNFRYANKLIDTDGDGVRRHFTLRPGEAVVFFAKDQTTLTEELNQVPQELMLRAAPEAPVWDLGFILCPYRHSPRGLGGPIRWAAGRRGVGRRGVLVLLALSGTIPSWRESGEIRLAEGRASIAFVAAHLELMAQEKRRRSVPAMISLPGFAVG
jgi:hypothetical protein